MNTTQIEILNILQKNFTKEDAEKIVTYLTEKSNENMSDLKEIFLTKNDKIDLITRMDTHFKWLAGIMIAAISLAVAIMKM